MRSFTFTILSVHLFLILAMNRVSCQVNLDSVRQILQSSESDSLKMEASFLLSKELSYSVPDSGLHYAQLTHYYAIRSQIITGVSAAYSQMGHSYSTMNQIDSAIHYWAKSASGYKQAKKELRWAKMTENIGMQYVFTGKYDVAKTYLDSAQEAFMRIDHPNQHHNKINYGILYDYMGDYEVAFKYYQQAYDYMETQNDRYYMGIVSSNICGMYFYIGDCLKSIQFCLQSLSNLSDEKYRLSRAQSYTNLAVCYEELNKIDSSLYYNDLALDILKEGQDYWSQARIHHNLGGLYSEQGELQLALQHLLSALKLKERFSPREGSSSTYLELTKLYTELSNISKAEEYLSRGEKIVYEVGVAEDIKDYLDYASEFYAETDRHSLAYTTQKKYVALKDSLLNIEVRKEIEEIREKYESEKKDREIVLLEKEHEVKRATIRKQQSYLTGSLVGLSGLMFGLYYLNLKRKSEKELFNRSVASLERENKEWYEKMQRVRSTKEAVRLGVDDVINIQEFGMSFSLTKLVYVQSDGNYILLYVEGDTKAVMLRNSLAKFFEEYLPESVFARINKSSVINMNYIASKTSKLVRVKHDDEVKQFSIGRPFKDAFKLAYDSLPNKK